MGFRSQDALLLVFSDPCTQSSFKCWRWQAGGADTFQEALQPLLRALLTIRHLLYSWQWSSTIVLNVKSKKYNCNHKGSSPSAPSSIHGNNQVQVHHGWCVLGLVLSILYAQYSILLLCSWHCHCPSTLMAFTQHCLVLVKWLSFTLSRRSNFNDCVARGNESCSS